MKATANIISSIQHLKMADEHLQSFVRDNPGARPVNLIRSYCLKINWILRDLFTNHHLPQQVRDFIKRETESDVFAVPAIQEKISLLTPDQREAVEDMIEIILKGETITVELKS